MEAVKHCSTMATSTNETLFPTLGPIYQRFCLTLARLLRLVGRLFVGVSVRRLMVFVLVLGLLLGWYVRGVRIQQAAVAAIEATGGSVFYDSQNRNEGPNFYYKPFGLKWLFHPRTLSPKWLVGRIGFDYTGAVVSARLGPKADDATMVQVGQLDRLESLGLSGSSVTDAGLARLKGLTLLRDLNLGQTGITDAGLIHLRKLRGLRLVDLWKTQVTDEGVLRLQDALHELQIVRDEDHIWTSVSQRAMKDLDFARSQPLRVACHLLARRAQAEAQQGQGAEVIATANAICSLAANDKVSLLKLATACESCLHSLDYLDRQGLSVDGKDEVQDRLARHGIGALSRAVDLGVKNLSYPPFQSFWFLEQHPGYRRLEAKLGLPQSPHADTR
jgi:hypothetical protein